MGKKSKRLNKALDIQSSVTNEERVKSGDSKKARKSKETGDVCASLDSSSIIDKKHRKRALIPEKTTGDEFENTTILEDTGKKKKKLKLLMEFDKVETGPDNVNSDDDDQHIPKKKKKKGKDSAIEEEIKHDPIKIEDSISKSQKKKKFDEPTLASKTVNKVDSGVTISMTKSQKKKKFDEPTLASKTVNKVDSGVKTPMTKSQKKKSTGVPVLNAEESQITEGDIDNFCNELDEEDNEQYLAWVKQIDAILPPKRVKDAD